MNNEEVWKLAGILTTVLIFLLSTGFGILDHRIRRRDEKIEAQRAQSEANLQSFMSVELDGLIVSLDLGKATAVAVKTGDNEAAMQTALENEQTFRNRLNNFVNRQTITTIFKKES